MDDSAAAYARHGVNGVHCLPQLHQPPQWPSVSTSLLVPFSYLSVCPSLPFPVPQSRVIVVGEHVRYIPHSVDALSSRHEPSSFHSLFSIYLLLLSVYLPTYLPPYLPTYISLSHHSIFSHLFPRHNIHECVRVCLCVFGTDHLGYYCCYSPSY